MPRRNNAADDQPIVAELGRPETPEETAARKAETSRLHRSNQTALNLVAALVVCLVVVLLIVLVVVRPNPEPPNPVDYAAVAEQAQPTVSTPLVSPELPDGWSANAAELETSSGVTSWYIGLITPGTQFIGVRQGIDANETWLASQIGFSQPTGAVTVDGITWQLYDNRDAQDDPGNLGYIMTAEHDASTMVLFGTAATGEFETLAASVSAELKEGEQ
ncbi:MAG TPA: DUF4245 domain-containing protein [Homoserinimonas sp.]|nr:DUF4245 domain-containing protein [Homoserinimonas sp.]